MTKQEIKKIEAEEKKSLAEAEYKRKYDEAKKAWADLESSEPELAKAKTITDEEMISDIQRNNVLEVWEKSVDVINEDVEQTSDSMENKMEWLNDGWYALGEGDYFVKTIDCGKLVVPTGQLLICDPLCYLDSEDITTGVRIKIPVGEYSVILSNEPGVGIVYASLIIGDKDETSRKPFLDMPEAIIPENIDRSNEFVGVPVETGTVCFVDEGALEYGMPPDKKLWDKQVIRFEGMDERYRNKMRMGPIADFFDKSMDKAAIEKLEKEAEEYKINAWEEAKKETLESLDKEAIAYLSGEEHWNYLLKNNKLPYINTRLPLASDGANIIVAHNFGGDGYFPVAGSYDAEGNLVAVHIVLFDVTLTDEDI